MIHKKEYKLDTKEQEVELLTISMEHFRRTDKGERRRMTTNRVNI